LALQPELLESKTYHFRTPHSLINRVKSPLWNANWMYTLFISFMCSSAFVLLLVFSITVTLWLCFAI
jgi:hypothetical protein